MYNIGDHVIVLEDTLKGIIINIDKELVKMKGEDGMIYQYHQSELLTIQQELYELPKYTDINHPLLKEKLVQKKKKGTHLKKEKKEVTSLPRNLLEAVDAFAEDKLVPQVFSKAMVNNFIGYKYDEWSRYHTTTTDWEIKEYLKLF